MQKSLMPKGVDHEHFAHLRLLVRAVQKSLMPKGVDHFRRGREEERLVLVQKSLMPKGVDHPSSDPWFDWWLECKNL